MSAGANWFAKKLGQPPPPQGGHPPVQQQSPPQYMAPPAQQNQGPQPQPGEEGYDPGADPNAATVTNLLRDPNKARGASKAEKFEQERCPGCGGTNYFSRAFNEAGGPIRGHPPAPECFDCGYPTVQYGSDLGAGGQLQRQQGGQQ